MTSDKQLVANQNNAQFSTGPITPQGKAIAARNAVQHGISAKGLILKDESLSDWELHQREVINDLRPVGYLESCLVSEIAQTMWRKQRIIRYETVVSNQKPVNIGEIVEQVECAETNFPVERDLNLILRYESHINRQLFGLMQQVREMQKNRERNQPTPIDVQQV